jgi:hypothetical protein
MCGHTFYHHCIKNLITKNKDKGSKVKCPINKGSIEVDKTNHVLFAKNIALISLLRKPKVDQLDNEFL